MSASQGSGNPLFDLWLGAQRRFLEAQAPVLETMKGLAGAGEVADSAQNLEDSWKQVERQAQDWIKTVTLLADVSGDDGDESIAEETLRRMFDPSRFLYAGPDEVSQAIERLVGGPEFADIVTLERQVLKTTKEWLTLREASARYHAITAAAWGRAFEAFSKEALGEPGTLSGGLRAMTDRWLAIANEELIRTQRTDEFLNAQRALLRAGVEYRLKERDLIEGWCETHSIPTRTEIDDLHRTVHTLRKQLREVKQRLADVEAKPARAAPRKKSQTTKNKD